MLVHQCRSRRSELSGGDCNVSMCSRHSIASVNASSPVAQLEARYVPIGLFTLCEKLRDDCFRKNLICFRITEECRHTDQSSRNNANGSQDPSSKNSRRYRRWNVQDLHASSNAPRQSVLFVMLEIVICDLHQQFGDD